MLEVFPELDDFGAETVEGFVGAVFHQFFVRDDLAVLDADWGAGEADFAADGPAVEGAGDGDGLDGALGAADDEGGATFELVDETVGGARAFGEDEDGAAGFEAAEDFADGRGVAGVVLDGDRVEEGDEPGEGLEPKEAGAAEELEVAVGDQ